MAGFSINKRAIAAMTRELQREFDRNGPIRIPVNISGPAIPGSTVNNYHGPVITGGTVVNPQFAYNNNTANQAQQTADASPRYQELIELITAILREVRTVEISGDDRQDVESAADDLLSETSRPEPQWGKLRRALALLRGTLAPIAAGAVTGTAEGTQEWAKTVIENLPHTL